MTATRKPTPEARPQLTSVELPIKHGHRRTQDDCPKCQEYRRQNTENLGW